MCVRKYVKFSLLIAAFAILGACGDMGAILPTTGTYKVSTQVNDLSLEDLSFVKTKDKIRPFFEESVSNDPDVTGLVVFLKDSTGEAVGVKVVYELDEDYIDPGEPEPEEEAELEEDDNEPQKNQENQNDSLVKKEDEAKPSEEKTGDETIDDDTTTTTTTAAAASTPKKTEQSKEIETISFKVKSLDSKLPLFPLPKDLPMGEYTFVYQVMGGKQILQKIEKTFFYLADSKFSFESIQVHLPGIAESAQPIPKGAVIMLEVKLDFDSLLDPYIVWYNGKNIVSEGKFKEGAGNILWKAPDQSGFFSLRAEVFPVLDYQELAGFHKDISLLVSSKTSDMHLLSGEAPGILHWYLFDGNLDDSKNASADFALGHEAGVSPKWTPAGGIYGLASGTGDVYKLPEVSFSNEEVNNWRIFYHLKPLNKGDILNVQFGSSDVVLNLSMVEKSLVLTLVSPVNTASQILELPNTGGFITGEIDFTVQPGQISASFTAKNKPVSKIISLEAEDISAYQITLGVQKNIAPAGEKDSKAAQKPVLTALWDEFALLSRPLVEVKTESVEEELPESEELYESYDESPLEI